MVRYELGKWNLDELAKNPNRKIIDKKLSNYDGFNVVYNLNTEFIDDTKIQLFDNI